MARKEEEEKKKRKIKGGREREFVVVPEEEARRRAEEAKVGRGTEVFRTEEGRLSGVTVGGKTFLGLSPEEVRTITEKERLKRETPVGAVEIQEARRQEEIEIEKQRLLAEEVPVRRELDPQRTVREQLPFLGTGVSAEISLRRTITKKIGALLGIPVEIGLSPEQLRTAELTAIEKEEIEKGLTFNEAFGGFVEAIPISGLAGAQFAKSLEMPSANAREVMSNIRKIKRQITNIETNVKMGYLPVSVAQGQVRDMENNIQRLESRLKMLINNSPSLKFNSDEVNTMETEILIVREKLFQSKLNILEGKIIDPDELNRYTKLQELNLIEEKLEE